MAIIYKKEMELSPYKEEQWTSNYIFAKMDNTILASIYINPRNSEEHFETVMWYLNQFRSEGYAVIAAGDFNLEEGYIRLNTEGY